MRCSIRRVDWEFVSVFRIAYRTQTHAETAVVELSHDELLGRGEGLGVSYHGETADVLLKQLQLVHAQVEAGLTRAELQSVLPAGGARNAIDCALWDLEAKRAGRRIYDLLELPSVRPLLTAYTLSIDTPQAMARAATDARRYSILKLKLTGEGDIERVTEVRAARPDAVIIVDANQSWNVQQLHEFTPRLADLKVKLIEQPLPAGADQALEHFDSPVPLCADESCQTTESLVDVVGKYQYINIKLDKTGGLTEALRLAREAKAAGLDLMAGCMMGSSLSMAPAFVIGQLCSVIDLDGPLWARSDVAHGITYQDSRMFAPEAALWG